MQEKREKIAQGTTAFYVNFQIFYLKNCIFLIFLSIFAILGCLVLSF